MNCRTFSIVVTDLARAHLSDVAAHADALEHARNCTSCASRLEDERTLTRGLAGLASVRMSETNALKSEERLRSAFAAHFAAGEKPSSVAQIHLLESARVSHWNQRRLLLGMAASVLLLLAATLIWQSTGSPERKQTQAVKGADVSASVKLPGGPKVTQSEVQQVVAQPKLVPVSKAHAGKAAKPIQWHTRQAESAYVLVTMGTFEPITSEREQATDFIPLMQSGDVEPMTSGQVMRVVMPRSAMAYFGLPVSTERPSENVKADVLYGEDGLARAIRFVR